MNTQETIGYFQPKEENKEKIYSNLSMIIAQLESVKAFVVKQNTKESLRILEMAMNNLRTAKAEVWDKL